MKIVVAMDSFKESLSARRACAITAGVIGEVLSDSQVITKPLADGGEGTADAMLAADGGEWISCDVMGPLAGMQAEAGFAWFEKDRSALVEMAKASGLELLTDGQRNPLRATTYGTGQLIRKAIECGAEKVYLAVGGSATVDCGVGAACALGWQFRLADGSDYVPGESRLNDIREIVEPEVPIGREVMVLCDVDNPLCGPRGAAKVYGPQKGATPKMVAELEAGLENIAELVEEQLGMSITDMPGAGAAGGLSAGAVAFMNAGLTSGTEYIIGKSGLVEALNDADWVVTGEGRLDEQSLQGKVIHGVMKCAKRHGVKVAVLAGQVALDDRTLEEQGIDIAMQCMEPDMTVEAAISEAGELLSERAAELAQELIA
ncbi:Glycerate kinase [Anaerohalosphaera lusitana]|uniref:Glycerate kinase n=1 Tax=Anaerohalosphaera lusitana TaxID=1936003 RepID=A0A1U9NIG3_9BACT|nr:glycerate kinase [Anaerohalosphaera lusitana]AQT67577.1 Glycerate kinase [Anaerohalosphaera lusitana]